MVEGRAGLMARRDNPLRHWQSHGAKANESYVHDSPFHVARNFANQFFIAAVQSSYFCRSKYSRAAFLPASFSME